MIWWSLLIAGGCYLVAAFGYIKVDEYRLAAILCCYAVANFIWCSIGGTK